MTDINKPSDCCMDATDSSISASGALRMIAARLRPVEGIEAAPLRSALGRILARPIASPINVPAYRNSAMDGYALYGKDIPLDGQRRLRVVGSAFAGQPYRGELNRGECIRIMTGAKVPETADTVIMQEWVERDGDEAVIDARGKPGANVRQAGEDIQAGAVILQPGDEIGPAQLGLLASLGIPEVAVYRRLRVAFFSSGDEIRSIGQPLEEGQIYDSNRYTLFGMLSELGADVIDMGVIADEAAAIQAAMTQAAREADLVLTSGGISVGEADFIAEAIPQLGEVHFAKVAIKPGRPLTFAHIGNAAFFGLPGNPVAVMITFLQFVRPAIQRLQGKREQLAPTLRVKAGSPLRKLPGRTEFQRGILSLDEQGELVVRSSGRQGSGVLSSMSDGNCLIRLSDETGNIQPGDLVEVQPFDLLRY
ncbi:gephyrin-like molybdotransferase Glp [Sedimenticola hydrogenitrophicus]|uniref:molybdopterin molybdotransferase MoeA n=1 Tax=Sedimenticola hydrogenitrophicus TaxID=2967975 RepID=UPI0021A2DF5B|nr:gephyrin-like molybdotransferase Glp [Sedimenticola hydrogenitrophicus]